MPPQSVYGRAFSPRDWGRHFSHSLLCDSILLSRWYPKPPTRPPDAAGTVIQSLPRLTVFFLNYVGGVGGGLNKDTALLDRLQSSTYLMREEWTQQRQRDVGLLPPWQALFTALSPNAS